jgi:hypothetical protein
MQTLKIIIACIATIAIVSCKEKTKSENHGSTIILDSTFNSNSLVIGEQNSTKKIHGQVLYLPVYSSVPYHERDFKYDLSAFVAIHNTDFKNSIRISKVLFFNNDGKLVANYLQKDTVINPLGAVNFFVPEKDQSGTGANFIIEWVSDSAVNEPLIESVMIGLTGGHGVSFTSTGKIVRELK